MEYRLTAKDITDEIMIEHFKRKGKTIIGTCGDCSSDKICSIQSAELECRDPFNKNHSKPFGCNHWEEKKND